jgi:transcriptional regulator with XRE-family HTH domain
MDYTRRQRRLIEDAINKTGSQSELARLMGVPRQTVYSWRTGGQTLTGPQVVRLQDLLKRVAAVLLAVALSSPTPEAGATGQNSVRGPDTKNNFHSTHCASFRRWARAVRLLLAAALFPSRGLAFAPTE